MDDCKATQSNTLLSSNKSKDKEIPSDTKDVSFLVKFKTKEYRTKVYHSLAVFLMYFTFGFQIGQRGPSFLDLQHITNTNVQKASTFFTVSAVGNLCGSLVVGLLLDKFNKLFLLFIATFMLAVTVTMVPLCSQYGLMLAILWANMFCMGWLNAGTNSYLLSVWGSSEGRSYMQALHSIFAFGAVISPLCTAPFLTKRRENINTYNTSKLEPVPNSSFSNNEDMTNLTIWDTSNDSPEASRLIYAFMISGIITLLSSIPLLVLFIQNKSKRPQNFEKRGDLVSKNNLPLPFNIITVVLLDIMFLCYCAIEDSFASYLTTFAVLHLNWEKTQGSQLTSIFWASFATARFLGIILIHYIRPGLMLLICGISVILNFTVFLLCSFYHIDEGVWCFTVLIGLSMSVIFPTSLSWIQENVLIVTGRVSSSILIAASIGMMLNPLTVGYLIQSVSPMWFCYLFVIESGCFILLALVFLIYSKLILPKIRRHYQKNVTM